MKALITGAAGFDGVNLTKVLLARKDTIIAVDSLSRAGSEQNLTWFKREEPGLVFHRCEIEDVGALIHQSRHDIGFHCAAQGAVTLSLESPTQDFRINAEGSFWWRGRRSWWVPRVIYTSTNKVYGENANHRPLVELPSHWEFAAPYAERGVAEIFSIDAAHHTPHGLSKLVGNCRCGSLAASPTGAPGCIGRPTIIYGDGKQGRDVLPIRDVIDVLVRQADQRVFYCDVSKAMAMLGWASTVGLEEGLADLFAWTKWSFDRSCSVS